MADKRRFVYIEVPIENKQYEQLENYSDVTGISVQDVVREAIANYVSCDIEAYYEVLGKRSQSA